MSERYNILVVDDEKRITESLVFLFEDDFNVIEYNNPIEALHFIKKNKNIDLIISDYKMPEMNGKTFLEKVKGISPKTFRLILSGYADAKELIKGTEQKSIHNILTKPWDPDILVSLVKYSLKNKR